ncbi:MAG: polyphenol oxidase family protein [Actinomycetota bacterium]|nr:polyphenol oxidase family protein [Actinomycetota bacterium]
MIRWEVPGPYEVLFTTRRGGVSEGSYASLNLGRKTGDDVERVDENRRRACTEIEADPERLALNYQVHSAVVRRAQESERGGVRADGLWTEEPGLPVLALSADCLPVALVRVNGATPAVCVLHAGRIGLLDGILEAGVTALGGTLAAAIGPAIGPCCYEVGEEVATPYRARFGAEIVRGRKLDLWQAAERVLRDAGVERVERFDLCTACNPELFFSHRRDGKPRGVQGVLARVS